MTRSNPGTSLAPLRQRLGLPPARRVPDLERSVRLVDVGRRHWLAAVAHLTQGARATCGPAAAGWARQQLVEWLEAVSDEDLDALADELVAELDEMRPRAVAA